MPLPPLNPPNKTPDGVTSAPSAPPLRPRKPNIQPEPIPEVIPQPILPDTTADSEGEAENKTIPQHLRSIPLGAPRKCPNCLYFPMKPLADFKDVDIQTIVRENDDYYQTRGLLSILPMTGILFWILRRVFNFVSSKAELLGKATKVQKAKNEILARCPNSLICPECCEVLEIY